MLSPDDIRLKCERKYVAFLRSLISGEPFFPLDIRFGRPSNTAEWSALSAEISALSGGNPGYTIDYEEVNTRRWGRQRLPIRVWFPDERAYLSVLRKQTEVGTFRNEVRFIREQCRALEDWLPGNVLRVIEYAGAWPGLLSVCSYFLTNPRPGLFARELPVPVDTKFIERHQMILRSLLDHLLPPSVRQEASHFETRFGLRFDEPLIRMRFLDPELQRQRQVPVDDLAVPLSQFQALGWSQSDLLIVENKMTFLTLPPRPRTLAILGSGGAAELLTSVRWFEDCRLLYWGDLDVHGFHILGRLRRTFAHLLSVMMDKETLTLFSSLCVAAKPAAYAEFETLTAAELAVYRCVADQGLMLEQEKLPPAYVMEQVAVK